MTLKTQQLQTLADVRAFLDGSRLVSFEVTTRAAARTGFTQAKRQVVLGDGAAWIWNLADVYLPNAIQIVDRFNVQQHLSDVAKAIYGASSDLATQWAHQRHEELDAGALTPLIAALSLHATQCECARRCIDYLSNNRHRMRYAEFQAQGLCTSTGMVAPAVRIVVASSV